MADDLSQLESRKYSGRGIEVGMTPDGNILLGYTLTGRSQSSQARVLAVDDNNIIYTKPTDQDVLSQGNPALLLYPAIIPVGSKVVASNGVQTNLLHTYANSIEDFAPADKVLEEAMDLPLMWYDGNTGQMIQVNQYEPDDPNFTPRIWCVADAKEIAFGISRMDAPGSETLAVQQEKGRGMLVTTYEGGNESPLEPFGEFREPFRLDSTTAQEFVENLYAAINHGVNPDESFAVAAAAMILSPEGKVIDTAVVNRHDLEDRVE